MARSVNPSQTSDCRNLGRKHQEDEKVPVEELRPDYLSQLFGLIVASKEIDELKQYKRPWFARNT
jgi:hypothetical protein